MDALSDLNPPLEPLSTWWAALAPPLDLLFLWQLGFPKSVREAWEERPGPAGPLALLLALGVLAFGAPPRGSPPVDPARG